MPQEPGWLRLNRANWEEREGVVASVSSICNATSAATPWFWLSVARRT